MNELAVRLGRPRISISEYLERTGRLGDGTRVADKMLGSLSADNASNICHLEPASMEQERRIVGTLAP